MHYLYHSVKLFTQKITNANKNAYDQLFLFNKKGLKLGKMYAEWKRYFSPAALNVMHH